MAKSDEREGSHPGTARGSGSPPVEAGSEPIPERLLVLARRLQNKLDALHGPAPATDKDRHR
jgi:hypothetical protein